MRDCYGQNGQDAGDFWATREQIGELLGYENPADAIRFIHKRNKARLDKFSMGVQIERGMKGARTATVYNFKGLLEICGNAPVNKGGRKKRPPFQLFSKWLQLQPNGRYVKMTTPLLLI
ncbi:MAG: hypothetical protein IJ520_09415 [Synergistaceae bacterium]|nr:hypothetical protein [Synergistaceae bacterium]MBR1601842.1 hypothetical protein [Synergistaceae bacterium]